MDRAHRLAASRLDPAPVKIVTDVEDVLRVVLGGTGPEDVGDEQLRVLIHAGHEAADALALLARPIAVHQVLVAAGHPRTREHVWAWLCATGVCDDLGVALARDERAIHAAPISNCKDVGLRLGVADGELVPSDAVVGHAMLRRPARPSPSPGGILLGRGRLNRGGLPGATVLQCVQGARAVGGCALVIGSERGHRFFRSGGCRHQQRE
mmetsp:Transcript_52548/g.140665  ORF Transcript_52548/g.140665 Transcript_52548/m.140665 type:complete len:209 (-) Transcript_52548:140-766(-)